MDGWMDDLRFYVLFNSISVISGRWADDSERPCAIKPRLGLRRFRLPGLLWGIAIYLRCPLFAVGFFPVFDFVVWRDSQRYKV